MIGKAVMQGIFRNIVKSSGRVLTVLALSALCTTAFAAPKMQGKKVASPAKAQMVKSRDNQMDKSTESLSEEEIFNRILQQKNLSADGKTLTDTRDGKKYSVEIRGDKAWMKKNLAFSISNPSQCLMESEEFCQKYGRFYSHQEAKKACPAGWHLPDDGEWRDYQKDRSKLDWKNLGQGGCKDWDGYCESSSTGHYWSASSVEKNTGRSWEFRSGPKSINRTDESTRKGLYVRCVADLR